VQRVGAVGDKISNRLNVSLRSGDAESGTAIVVVGVNLLAKDLEALHEQHIVVKGSVV